MAYIPPDGDSVVCYFGLPSLIYNPPIANDIEFMFGIDLYSLIKSWYPFLSIIPQ